MQRVCFFTAVFFSRPPFASDPIARFLQNLAGPIDRFCGQFITFYGDPIWGSEMGELLRGKAFFLGLAEKWLVGGPKSGFPP